MASSLKRSITKRFLFGIAIAGALLGSLLVVALIFSPYLVSSKWVKAHIEAQVSHSLNREMRFEKMAWKWKGQLRLEGIQVPDTPAFSKKPVASIKAAEINISWTELIKNRVLLLHVTINGLSINLIRNRSGGTNIEALVSSCTAKKTETAAQEPADSSRSAIWPFTDLKGRIQLADLTLHMTDRIQNRTIVLSKGRIDFKFPSIIKDPVKLTIFSQVEINHQKAPPIQIDMVVSDFFHPEKWIDANRISVDLNAEAPGTKVTIHGNLARKWFKGRVESDLAISVPLLSPFLQSNLSDVEAKGTLIVDLSAKNDPRNPLSFKTHLLGSNIFLNGDLFKNVPVNLDAIKITNHGTFDFQKNQLRIDYGLLQLSENKINWQGTIEQLGNASPAVQINLKSITLDLGDILQLADRFLPDQLPRILFEGTVPPARLEVAEAQVKGDLVSGPLLIEIRNATLTAPKVALLAAGMKRPKFQAEQFQLSISELQATLIDLFPRQINISGSVSSSRLRLDGKNSVSGDQIRLSQFYLSVDDIFKSTASRFGVTCRFSLTTSLQTGHIAYQELLSLSKMDHSMAIEGRLRLNNHAEISLKTFKLNMADAVIFNQQLGNIRSSVDFIAAVPMIELIQTDPLKMTLKNLKADLNMIDLNMIHPRLGAIHTGGNLTSMADMIELNETNPFKLNVRGFTSHLNITDLLKFQIQADVEDTGLSMAKTKGRAEVNLSNIFKTFRLKSMGIRPISGQVDLTWNFSGHLPQKAELNQMKPTSFLNKRPTLSFIDYLGISCLLKDVDVDGLMGEDLKVGLGQITTPTPLTYLFDKKNGSGHFKGDMVMNNITGVASLLGEMPLSIPPLTARLGFSGTHHGLHDFTLSQSLDIKPFDIKETLKFSISGIHGLLDSGWRLNQKQWPSSLTGSAHLELQIKDADRLHFLPQALRIKGGADMGAGIRFQSDRDINISGWFRTIGMDVKIGNAFDVKKLQVDIDFNKRYLIISNGARKTSKKQLFIISGDSEKPFDQNKNVRAAGLDFTSQFDVAAPSGPPAHVLPRISTDMEPTALFKTGSHCRGFGNHRWISQLKVFSDRLARRKRHRRFRDL